MIVHTHIFVERQLRRLKQKGLPWVAAVDALVLRVVKDPLLHGIEAEAGVSEELAGHGRVRLVYAHVELRYLCLRFA